MSTVTVELSRTNVDFISRSPIGGYSVIYADPPWYYRDKALAGHRGASSKYPCMKTLDLCALPVECIAAENAVLLMWAVPPMMKDAMQVIDAWGFKYKTFGFLWAKRNPKSNRPAFGMGHWTRANAEPCLLAIRGKPKRASAAVSQFVWSPRLRHSEKPAVVREKIVELCGDVPRIELFSRHVIPGWARWGNQVLP